MIAANTTAIAGITGLTADSVTSTEIATDAVGSDKIAITAVDVTKAKIADNAVNLLNCYNC